MQVGVYEQHERDLNCRERGYNDSPRCGEIFCSAETDEHAVKNREERSMEVCDGSLVIRYSA